MVVIALVPFSAIVVGVRQRWENHASSYQGADLTNAIASSEFFEVHHFVAKTEYLARILASVRNKFASLYSLHYASTTLFCIHYRMENAQRLKEHQDGCDSRVETALLIPAVMARCQWVKPVLIAKVKFTEWAQGNQLRRSRGIDGLSKRPSGDR